ncbi:MAG: serine/threonine protein kinase [Chloroflexi bacterium]|nr:serine/threonine protein kinase [Chloroflexota bacterium]
MDRVLDQRYRIVEPIGVGGSSQVYLAYDESLRRDVAVKVLDAQAASDPGLRKLFVREAQALAKLSHPNVVGVHDVGEVDGLPYIVMEHLPGLSLKQRIERDGPLSVAEAVRLATEIANGLSFAHSRGIVHADMKPSNILLTDDGRAKIADFGIARMPQEDASTPQLFATAMYVAPERVEGKPLSPQSDIYGLGLVLYEMLVGRPPFTSANPSVLLRDHVVRQPVPPSHLRQSLPRELDSVVMKCLAKDPGLRYVRASDVAKALASLENVGSALATTRVAVMTEPLQGIVPRGADSPVVAFLQAYGSPIRRAFFAVLAGAPVFGLMTLAGFELVPALALAALVAIVGGAGQLGTAISIAWIVETACIFLFVPGLAVLFAFMGLWIWLRDVPPERTAIALAMPVIGPIGLGPAFVLASAAIHGLGGVVSVGWGAILTVLFAVSAGKQTLGAFVQTGIALEPTSLFDTARALETKAAFLYLLRPGAVEDRFGPLREVFDPDTIVTQMGTVVSRTSAADVAALATVIAWIVAALVVWTVTRLLRSLFDTFVPRRWFALYVFATAVGVSAGAAVLYMTYVTWAPLALSPGRPAASLLLVSAAVGAVIALALGVVISATEHPEPEEDVPPPVTMPISVR